MFFLCYRLKTTLFLANKSFVCSVKGEVWEVVDDVHCLGADVDDGEEEVKDVARFAMLTCPVVGIVLDERLLVDGDAVAFNYPFDSTLAVHDVVVGF